MSLLFERVIIDAAAAAVNAYFLVPYSYDIKARRDIIVQSPGFYDSLDYYDSLIVKCKSPK